MGILAPKDDFLHRQSRSRVHRGNQGPANFTDTQRTSQCIGHARKLDRPHEGDMALLQHRHVGLIGQNIDQQYRRVFSDRRFGRLGPQGPRGHRPQTQLLDLKPCLLTNTPYLRNGGGVQGDRNHLLHFATRRLSLGTVRGGKGDKVDGPSIADIGKLTHGGKTHHVRQLILVSFRELHITQLDLPARYRYQNISTVNPSLDADLLEQRPQGSPVRTSSRRRHRDRKR